jgi:tetratricopeptide (TPR) repeat protein
MESRVEFQTLMVQLLLQRRFQHVIISTRFYRSIFDDGDNRLRLSKETLDRLSSTGGGDSPGPSSFFPLIGGLLMDLPPTVTSLELLANEFIKDAGQGVESAGFLLRKDELKGATHRLAESFVLGEHLPALQQFPHEDRQRIYEFARRGDELTTAIEVKDYLRAEALARQMQEMAKDFDPTEALTAVQTFRNVSRMHLARARNAALGGDAGTLERELRAATEIWPNNPDLADVSGQIFQQTDLQQQALSELQRLIEQGDHRAIFRQNAKFIAATALYPEWQEKLGTILEAMTEIEGSLQRAREIQQRGDAAGAWESIQLASVKYPEDNEINRLRADLASGGAATFVQALNKGDELEARGEYGAALAWYLDAHRQYPPSKFAQEKISALAERILPGASPAAP